MPYMLPALLVASSDNEAHEYATFLIDPDGYHVEAVINHQCS
ncbi:hypothetical protein BH11PSE12_BH11PSE12_09580 [soil metagenome]